MPITKTWPSFIIILCCSNNCASNRIRSIEHKIYINNVSNMHWWYKSKTAPLWPRNRSYKYLVCNTHIRLNYLELVKLHHQFSILILGKLFNWLMLARLGKKNKKIKEALEMMSKQSEACQGFQTLRSNFRHLFPQNRIKPYIPREVVNRSHVLRW